MSLNKQPESDLPETVNSGSTSTDSVGSTPAGIHAGGISSESLAIPDYVGLVSFLVKPFLESPESLRVDCEVSTGKPRVWIRLAFDASDKGRVFGRGGRNIQAIRTLLTTAAQAVGQVAYLDVYGAQNFSEEESEGESRSSRSGRSSQPRRSGGRSESGGKQSIKLKNQRQVEE